MQSMLTWQKLLILYQWRGCFSSVLPMDPMKYADMNTLISDRNVSACIVKVTGADPES